MPLRRSPRPARLAPRREERRAQAAPDEARDALADDLDARPARQRNEARQERRERRCERCASPRGPCCVEARPEDWASRQLVDARYAAFADWPRPCRPCFPGNAHFHSSTFPSSGRSDSWRALVAERPAPWPDILGLYRLDCARACRGVPDVRSGCPLLRAPELACALEADLLTQQLLRRLC